MDPLVIFVATAALILGEAFKSELYCPQVGEQKS